MWLGLFWTFRLPTSYFSGTVCARPLTGWEPPLRTTRVERRGPCVWDGRLCGCGVCESKTFLSSCCATVLFTGTEGVFGNRIFASGVRRTVVGHPPRPSLPSVSRFPTVGGVRGRRWSMTLGGGPFLVRPVLLWSSAVSPLSGPTGEGHPLTRQGSQGHPSLPTLPESRSPGAGVV